MISVYWEKFLKGNKTNPLKGTRVVFGTYNENLKPDFKKKKYNLKDKITRECQITADFLFKYFRHKDEKVLQMVQRRLYWR